MMIWKFSEPFFLLVRGFLYHLLAFAFQKSLIIAKRREFTLLVDTPGIGFCFNHVPILLYSRQTYNLPYLTDQCLILLTYSLAFSLFLSISNYALTSLATEG